MKIRNRTKSILFVMIICLLVGCFSFESEAAAKIYWKNTANTRTVLVNSSTTLKTNYKNSKVRWSSSNKKIATVSSKGKVKFKKTGTVTIKCRTKKSSKRYVKCKFYVKKKASGFKISPGRSTLYVGESCSSNFSIYPSNAYSVRTWGSSNTSVATVDGNGKVTARKSGQATITATLKDGTNRKSSYTVNVISRIVQSEAGTRFIAHRGFSSQAPENTIKAFELAGDAGFWGAECDVQVTNDGEFVIYHNDQLDTCDKNDYIKDVSLEYIKSQTINFEKVYNYKTYGKNFLKYKGEKSAYTIPTLEEYLDVCLQKNMIPVIEIKMAYNVLGDEEKKVDSQDNPDENQEANSSENAGDKPEENNQDTNNSQSEVSLESLSENTEEVVPEDTNTEDEDSEEAEMEDDVSQKEQIAVELEEEIRELPELHVLNGQEVQDVDRTTLERLYDQVKEKMGNKPYIFISFDEKCILKMESLYQYDEENEDAPNMKIQWLFGNGDNYFKNKDICIEKKRGVDIKYGSTSLNELMNVKRKNGNEINIWTVDNAGDTRKCFDAGVDYITTNVKNFE